MGLGLSKNVVDSAVGNAPAAKAAHDRKHALVQTLVGLTVTSVLSVLALIWVYPVKAFSWNMPLDPVGDGVAESIIVKTMVEQPWYFRNPRMGAPGALNWYDFPTADSLHFAILKIFAVLTRSYGLALNLYFLFGFILIAWTAFFVLREFGLSFISSIVGAELYAFAPYHMIHGEGHLQLSSYYMVPLTILVIVWVMSRVPMLGAAWSMAPGQRIPRLTKAGWASIIICILTGSAGVYYAFFGVLLLMGAGLRECVTKRSFDGTKNGSLFGKHREFGGSGEYIPRFDLLGESRTQCGSG